MVAQDGVVDSSEAQAQLLLPKGRYTLVGIDIDTTGRRLIDEIVQLAAFTPDDHFEQYIMPYMNLNPAARQRHQVRVISIGFYRMLKSMQTYKIIKSKSEIAALKDFLDWLEALKAKDADSQGVILVYHEERKFIPYMVLESVKKYNLLDRFLGTVKSFANGLSLAKANSNHSYQRYSLRKLSKVLGVPANKFNGNSNNDLNNSSASSGSQSPNKNNMRNKPSYSHERDLFDGNASVRARLAYEVALRLSNQESKEAVESSDGISNMLNALHDYALPIDRELNELQTQNENLERQNSFRPVFLHYFKSTLYHRVRAVKFRIVLAEQGYDLVTLNQIWNDKKRDGLLEVMQPIEDLKQEDKKELSDLFDSFFDPNKTTLKPAMRNNNNNNNNNRRRNRRGGMRNMKQNGNGSARNGSESGAGGDKEGTAQIPDSTTKSPHRRETRNNRPRGGRGPPRGKRGNFRPRSRNSSIKQRNANIPQSANAATNTSIPIAAAT